MAPNQILSLNRTYKNYLRHKINVYLNDNLINLLIMNCVKVIMICVEQKFIINLD